MNQYLHQPTHILLADANPHVRLALRHMIEHISGRRAFSEAADVIQLLSQAASVCPGLAVIDAGLPLLALPQRDPPDILPELLQMLRKLCPGVPLVVLSSQPIVMKDRILAYADALVSKSDPPADLVRLIEDLLPG